MKIILKIASIIFFYTSVQCIAGSVPKSYPVVIRVIPHDARAFTQGLVYYNGRIYESTGLYGQSSLRCVDPADGRIIKSTPVPDIFAEGLARMDDKLVQISWKEKTALVYSIPDFMQKKSFTYNGEGWGLTSDSKHFIMSNGSDTLYIRSKEFVVLKKIPVTLDGVPLKNLNELEYVKGMVYSNIWYSNDIAVIDLSNGKVQRLINCTSLVQKASIQNEDEVLNGIAYKAETGTFFVTGKNWRYMFEVNF
jgi:glutaminyl-peptide cyclotransferase